MVGMMMKFPFEMVPSLGDMLFFWGEGYVFVVDILSK